MYIRLTHNILTTAASVIENCSAIYMAYKTAMYFELICDLENWSMVESQTYKYESAVPFQLYKRHTLPNIKPLHK